MGLEGEGEDIPGSPYGLSLWGWLGWQPSTSLGVLWVAAVGLPRSGLGCDKLVW